MAEPTCAHRIITQPSPCYLGTLRDGDALDRPAQQPQATSPERVGALKDLNKARRGPVGSNFEFATRDRNRRVRCASVLLKAKSAPPPLSSSTNTIISSSKLRVLFEHLVAKVLVERRLDRAGPVHV